MSGIEKNIDVLETQETDVKGTTFRNIEVVNPESVEECKSFWNDLFSKVIEKNITNDVENNETSDVSENKKTFSSIEEMKEQYDVNYKEIRDQKPFNSPDLEKWFEKGGTLEIEEKDGKQVWTYINPEGIAVSYIDGYPIFPSEIKHPFIGDIDIGSFSGDRNEDKKLYLEKLEEEYGLTEIPKGYALHHDTENGIMQLVNEEYHKEFTHAGGHSKFKEGSGC